MKSWFDIYSKILNSKLFKFEEKKGVIVGFNANVDKIIEINPKKILQIISPEIINQINLNRIPSSCVENQIDFFSSLFNSIKYGKADEFLTDSKRLSTWIENVFEIKKIKIGGQAGIIANLYNKLGLKHVLLSLPILNKTLISLLDPNILTILKNRSSYSINLISTINIFEEQPIFHYVFEFVRGTYLVGKHKIDCPRDNRFILSYDEINTQLKFNQGFIDYCDEFLLDYSLAIISGFHLINIKRDSSQSFYDVIRPVEIMLKKWKITNPSICLHLEIASTKNIKLRQCIVETLFPLVDSIGLNEQELMSFIEILNPELSNQLRNDLNSIIVFKAINEIFQRYSHLRIHFHYLGYFLIISRPIDIKKAQERKKGLILSSLYAAVKANGLDITSAKDIRNIPLDISVDGYDELKKLQTYLKSHFSIEKSLHTSGLLFAPSFCLVGVPTIVVTHPKELVGLGDLISSISILHEIQ